MSYKFLNSVAALSHLVPRTPHPAPAIWYPIWIKRGNINYMEKRILGIILSFLGIAGLILGAIEFLNGGSSTRNVKEVIIYAILGAIFFFAGVSLVRNTKDRPT